MAGSPATRNGNEHIYILMAQPQGYSVPWTVGAENQIADLRIGGPPALPTEPQ